MEKYFKVLELSSGASKDEIKKSFRRLAHLHHPDKTGGSDAKFKEISEAYTVLIKYDGPVVQTTHTYTTWNYSPRGSDGFYAKYKEQAEEKQAQAHREAILEMMQKMQQQNEEALKRMRDMFNGRFF